MRKAGAGAGEGTKADDVTSASGYSGSAEEGAVDIFQLKLSSCYCSLTVLNLPSVIELSPKTSFFPRLLNRFG